MLRVGGWGVAMVVVVVAVVMAGTWVWWRAAPSAEQRSRGVNAVWGGISGWGRRIPRGSIGRC